MFDLVETTTADNLILYGLHLPGDKNKPVLVHIHGFEGDFFTNRFIKPLANTLKENNIGFLTVQTRGMGSDYGFKTINDTWKRYGAHFERHEEAYMDIDAWIKFLQEQGYKNIILQGHSLGTMKIIRYLFEGSHPELIKKLILLAPFDNIYMAKSFENGKRWRINLEAAKQKVAEGKGEELMPKDWWDVEMSYQTYISWLDDNDFTHMFDFHDKKYPFPILNKIEIPVKVIVGTKDDFLHTSNKENPQEAMDIMKKNIKDFSFRLIDGATHSYTGYEEVVVEEILKYIK